MRNQILLAIFAALLFNNTSYAAETKPDITTKDTQNTTENDQENLNPEEDQTLQEQQKEDQLKSYSNITKWIIDNDANFEKVIEETSKDSKTKWFIQEDVDKALQKDAESSAGQVTPQKKETIEYIVQKGDTLFSLSKKYGVPQEQIKKDNNLSSEALVVGSKLKINSYIPKVPSTEKAGEDNKLTPGVTSNELELEKLPEIKNYKVQQGDTIYSIAKKADMSKKELEDLNGFNVATVLSVGQIIKIKSNYAQHVNAGSSIVKDGFLWPVVGRLLIPFGPQSGGTVNEGINISAHKGTPIKATQDGVVTYVGNTLPSFGTLVLIQHSNDWISVYGHLDTALVTKGQKVKKGDKIGTVGTSGGLKTSQLHFELRYRVKPQDPLDYLNSYR